MWKKKKAAERKNPQRQSPDAAKDKDNALEKATWGLRLGVEATAFGPITFDRLAISTITGKPRSDPQLGGYLARVGFERQCGLGSYGLSFLYRYFEPVENSEQAHYSDQSPGYTRDVNLDATGLGLAWSWSFWRDRPLERWRQFFDVAIERSSVGIEGAYRSVDGAENLHGESTLYSAYTDLGLGYAVYRGAITAEIALTVTLPLARTHETMALNNDSATLLQQLNHGLRGGIALGLNLAWDLQKSVGMP